VVLDTAPTGHSLLLMDATGAYHRQSLRTLGAGMNPARITTPLMRLQDPNLTRIIVVTLPETTPVSQAAALQEDLRRAHIEPFGDEPEPTAGELRAPRGGILSEMSQSWTLDPNDPRAPSSEVWRALTPEQRAKVVASLPSEWEDTAPSEGDPHWIPKVNARKTLERYFSRLGRKAYVGSELAIYYPAERVFAPDVFVVLDVEPHERERWVVDDERRGLDWVLEIHVSGERRKDHVRNVEWFARLGIPEYFIYDRGKRRISAWQLETVGARRYVPMLAQRGRYVSRVLGLEIGVLDERLRFFSLDAELPEAEELISKLERAVSELERRADEESRRAEEESRRADSAEARLAEALRELERLKG
jgi:Uma2 family endonuclease